MAKMKLSEIEKLWTLKVAALGGSGSDVINATERFLDLKKALAIKEWVTCLCVKFGGDGHHPWGSQITAYVDIKSHGKRISANTKVSIGGTSRTVTQMVSTIADLQRATELAAYAEQLFDCEIEADGQSDPKEGA